MKVSLTKGDFFVIIFFLSLSFFLFYSFSFHKNKSKFVEIVTPYKKLVFSLNKNKTIKIKGKLGYLIAEIKDRKVRVISSSCPNKICVKTGWIKKVGDMIVCVPNGVIIKIVGNINEKEKDVDFITE